MSYNITSIFEDLKNGKPIIIIDKKNDISCMFVAGEKLSYEVLNFIFNICKGQIRGVISQNVANKLFFSETFFYNSLFTLGINIKNNKYSDLSLRGKFNTIIKLANQDAKSDDFVRSENFYLAISKKDGLIEKQNSIEAAIDLCNICKLYQVGIISEIINENGDLLKTNEIETFSKKYNLKVISLDDILKYRKTNETLMKVEVEAYMPTSHGTFKIIAFENKLDGKEHIALVKGEIKDNKIIPVRIHSECFTGDILGSLKCDCGSQLHTAMERIEKNGFGIILYLRQEGRGIGLINKLKAYKLQEIGVDTLDANLQLGFDGDLRDYGVAAQMLKALGVSKVKLLTNNPLKIQGLKDYGIEVVEREEIEIESNNINKSYLITKKERMGHLIEVKKN